MGRDFESDSPSDGAMHEGAMHEDLEGLFSHYVDELNRGEELNPEEILARHPQVGEELLQCLEGFAGPGGTDVLPLGVLGDYTLRRRIGRGGMGVVYDAWENSMDRQVALKVLPVGIAADDKAYMRFMREAKTAGKLSHPNVVSVFGMGVKEQTPYYAMEYVEGETLAQVLGRLKEAESEAGTVFGKKDSLAYYSNLADAFADVADGLQHAHSKGVIHRDIKPSNLILDAESDQGGRTNGRLRILDFGLARLEGQESLTLTGDFVGTPAYMSPEQARRRKIPVDHRTDIYSLGATLYELLTQQQPFRGKDHHETLSQIIERDPRPPRQLNPRVPVDLETVVLKCLRKDAEDRYGTAEAVGQDLRRFVRGDPIEARPEGRYEQWRRMLWKGRKRIAVLFVVLLLVITTASLSLRLLNESWNRRDNGYQREVLKAVQLLELSYFSGTLGRGSVRERQKRVRDFWRNPRLVPSNASRASLDEAVARLRAAIVVLPERADARYHLARSLWLLEETDAALSELRWILDRTPEFVPARALLAAFLEQVGDHESSRRVLQRTRNADVEAWLDAWFNVQDAMAKGDWPRAEAAYTELIRGDDVSHLGSSLEMRLGRGIARLEAGKHDSAMRDFMKAHSHFPDALAPVLFLGETYLRKDAPAEADEWFQEYFADAALVEGTRLEIVVLFLTNNYPSWAQRWTPGLREDLKERILTLALGLQGEFCEAVEPAQRALAQNADDPLHLALLGWAWSGCFGNREAAERYLGEALQDGHGDAFIQFTVGSAFMSLDDPSRAQRHYQEAIALDPEFTKAREHLAWAYAEMDRYEEAIDVLSEVLGRDPAAFYAHLNQAGNYRALGRLDEARRHFEEARRLAPGDTRTLTQLGRLEEQEGRFREAKELFREAIEVDGDLALPKLSLARVLAKEGHSEESLKLYCQAIPQIKYRRELHGAVKKMIPLLESCPENERPVCLSELAQYLESYAESGEAPRQILRAYRLLKNPGTKGG